MGQTNINYHRKPCIPVVSMILFSLADNQNSKRDVTIVKMNGRWGFIDKNGNLVI